MEIKISIVEDSKEQGKLLENCLLEWADHYGISAGIFRYEQAEEFLDTEYQENFLIFLDIDLKTTTGLVVAGKIRKAGYQGHIIGEILSFLSKYIKKVQVPFCIRCRSSAVDRKEGWGVLEKYDDSCRKLDDSCQRN